MASSPGTGAIDRARAKAYVRLLPILLASYVIAYVDRINVGVAKLTMQPDLKHLGFSEAAFGFGMGVFFAGYLVLEIPGTLLVEHWSARKWISRIMISWGIVAAMTAFVHCRVPGVTWLAQLAVGALVSLFKALAGSNLGWISRNAQGIVESLQGPGSPFVLQFFSVRFLLGLAEAGFYPGVIVYLTHWFPARDRTKTLAWFFIGTPLAAIIAPPISVWIMKIGTDGRLPLLGMVGWQWVFILWGIPAVILGVLILFYLTDRPAHARWLTDDERVALEETLAREARAESAHRPHDHPPGARQPEGTCPCGSLLFRGHGQLRRRILHGVDRQRLVRHRPHEDRLLDRHPRFRCAHQPAVDRLELRPHSRAPLACLSADHPGCRGTAGRPRQPGVYLADHRLFYRGDDRHEGVSTGILVLPSIFLAESAAAASIGLINSCGNLGGWAGPTILGFVRQATGNYRYGLWFLSISVIVSALIIANLGIGAKATPPSAELASEPEPEALIEPV